MKKYTISTFLFCLIAVTSVMGQEILRRGKLIDSTLTIGVSPIRIKSLDSTGETSGQVLTSQGAGHPPHWVTAAVPSSSNYYKEDGGTPVRTPSVTAATKGISIGDSAAVTAYGAQAFGRRTTASAIDAVAIGSLSNASGNYSIAIGGGSLSATARGIGAICIGGFDFCTSQVNDGQHDYNILIGGATQNTSTTDALNVAIGYNVNVRGAGNTCIGSNVYANGSAASYETFVGFGVGNQVAADGKYQTILGGYGSLAVPTSTANLPHLNHDSTTVLGISDALYSRNARNTLIGSGNDTTAGGTFSNATKHLFDVGNGGLYGNATRSNALTVLMNGDVMIGRNISEPTPSAPGSAAATGRVGDIVWDSGFIYVCIATNTWKRVAIATW